MAKKSLLVVMFTLMTSLVYKSFGLFFPSHAPIMCGEYSAVESF